MASTVFGSTMFAGHKMAVRKTDCLWRLVQPARQPVGFDNLGVSLSPLAMAVVNRSVELAIQRGQFAAGLAKGYKLWLWLCGLGRAVWLVCPAHVVVITAREDV